MTNTIYQNTYIGDGASLFNHWYKDESADDRKKRESVEWNLIVLHSILDECDVVPFKKNSTCVKQ